MKRRKDEEHDSQPSKPSASSSAWRLFFALELTEEIRVRVAEHIARLRRAQTEARVSWERPEKLHLTLKFLGNVEREHLDALSSAAARASLNVQPLSLMLADAGSFPPRGQPRVLWLGIKDQSGQLTHLQKNLEDECAAAGFKREERPYRPHLTIARLRQPQDTRALAALHRETGFDAIEFAVKDFVLMRSEMSPGGSRHTILSRQMLDAGC